MHRFSIRTSHTLLPRATPAAAVVGGHRGFTLMELMVVVVIVGILAVMAAPRLTSTLDDKRVLFRAQNITNVLREARSRALGRGSAVWVHLSGDGSGNATSQFGAWERTVLDVQASTERRLPFASCTQVNVDTEKEKLRTTSNALLQPDQVLFPSKTSNADTIYSVRMGTRPEWISPPNSGNNNEGSVACAHGVSSSGIAECVGAYICFSPWGRTFAQDASGGAASSDPTHGSFRPLEREAFVEIWRSAVGGSLKRKVILPQSGTPRVLSKAP